MPSVQERIDHVLMMAAMKAEADEQKEADRMSAEKDAAWYKAQMEALLKALERMVGSAPDPEPEPEPSPNPFE